jgi:type II secretory pathway pseudopilin PulG
MNLHQKKIARLGFTLTEVMVALSICVLVVAGVLGSFGYTLRLWKRSDTLNDIQTQGRRAYGRIVKTIRTDFIGFTQFGGMAGGIDLTGGFAFHTDADGDGTPDGMVAWYLRPMPTPYGRPDQVLSTSSPGLWELWESRSGSASFDNASWQSLKLCSYIVAPWTTQGGTRTYEPFEFRGSDPELDVGHDGIVNTLDEGERDGIVDATEIGNFINGDGVINHAGERIKVTSIAFGLRLQKESLPIQKLSEDAVIYAGVVAPRNRAP